MDTPNTTNPQPNGLPTPEPTAPPKPNEAVVNTSASPEVPQATQAQPVPPVSQIPPAPVMGTMPAASVPSKKSHKLLWLIIGIVTLVFISAIVAVFVWVFMFSPAAQAKRVSTAFMKALTTNDTEKLFSLADASDPGAKAYLEEAAKKSQGTFKLKDLDMENGAGYFLYDLSNSEGKMGRTTVEKQSGKYMVTGYVYGSDNLALIPASNKTESQQQNESQDSSTPAPTAAPTPMACIMQTDYKWFNYNKEGDSVTYETTYVAGKTFNKTGSMFFHPDSIEEQSFTSIYDDWADFASKNSDKQWKFRLEGSTYGSDAVTAASKQLANSRAEEVKRELTSRGVPADRIAIDSPHDYGKEVQDDSLDQIYRRVQVTIDPTCTSTAPSSSSGQ